MGRSSSSKIATIVSTATVPFPLADGTSVDPGVSYTDVDMSLPHNRDLYFDGHLSIIDGFTPRTRQHDSAELVEPAEDKTQENPA